MTDGTDRAHPRRSRFGTGRHSSLFGNANKCHSSYKMKTFRLLGLLFLNGFTLLLATPSATLLAMEESKMPRTPDTATSPNKSSGKGSIVGQWNRQFAVMPFEFGADSKMRWEQNGKKFSASYRLDTSKNPAQIDLFDFDNPEMATKGARLSGIFEIMSDGRMRFETGPKQPGGGATKFSEEADIYQRASGSSGNTIVGQWLRLPVMKETYTFTADGTVRTYFESRGLAPARKEYRYQLDQSTKPVRLNFFFGEINDDPSFRGILEFQTEDSMRLDGRWTKEEKERPTTFGEDTYIFSRAR